MYGIQADDIIECEPPFKRRRMEHIKLSLILNFKGIHWGDKNRKMLFVGREGGEKKTTFEHRTKIVKRIWYAEMI